MAWIESHQSLGQHPKLFALAESLGVPCPAAVGHLHFLWWWAAQYASTGRLDKYTDTQIARAAHWQSDPKIFIDALLQSRFLDRRNGRLALHDWGDYRLHYDLLMEKRERQTEQVRDRVARFRRKTKNVTLGNANVTQSNASTVPNQTLHNQTIPNRNTASVTGASPPGDYPIPEPKEQPVDALIMAFKFMKGVPYDHTGWDAKFWEKARPYADQLLRDCVVYSNAYACLQHYAKMFKERGYKDWTLKAISDIAIEWMGAHGGEQHGTSNSERFFEALRKQRGVGKAGPGLRATDQSLPSGLRDLQRAQPEAGEHQLESGNGHVEALEGVRDTAGAGARNGEHES